MPNNDLVERTGLTQIVQQLTYSSRGANILDRVYVASLQLYNSVHGVMSIVKSDHNTVVAYSDQSKRTQPKLKNDLFD